MSQADPPQSAAPDAAEERGPWVLFRAGRGLLDILHVYLSRRGQQSPFPAFVVRGPDGQLALPLSKLGQPGDALTNELKEVCAQVGVEVGFASGRPIGTLIQLATVFRPAWMRCDPLHLIDETPGGLGTRGAEASFILAAADEKESRTLFKILSDFLVDGIEFCPIQRVATSTPPSQTAAPLPWQFFWRVTGARPPFSVLETAAWVWWTPVDSGYPYSFYYRWPYRLSFDPSLLQRIQWGERGSTILLGPDLGRGEPVQVVLTAPRPERHFASVADYGHVTLGAPTQVLRVQPCSAKPLQFNVSLRLLDRPSPADILARRIHDLEAEIDELTARLEARTKSCEALRGRHPDLQIDDAPRCPALYVYRSAPDQIPHELKTLLIEWSDQDKELRAMRYAAVPASSLDGETDRGEIAHILAPAAALETVAMDDVMMRLERYAPLEGGLGVFELQTEWARAGLRLFVPIGRNHRTMELYPRLPVGKVAAAKLARAVGIPPDSPPDAWCVLLLPTRAGKVRACRLRCLDFTLLVDAFQWECRLATTVSQATLVSVREEAEQKLLNAVSDGFAGAVKGELGSRIKTVMRESQARISASAELAAQHAALRQLFDAAVKSLRRLDRLGRLLADGELEGVARKSRKAGGAVRTLNSLAQRIHDLQAQAQKLGKDLQTCLGRWQRLCSS